MPPIFCVNPQLTGAKKRMVYLENYKNRATKQDPVRFVFFSGQEIDKQKTGLQVSKTARRVVFDAMRNGKNK